MTGPLWVYTPALTDPSNGITTSFSEGVLAPDGLRSVTLNGTASSPAGIAKVEIINYTTDSGVVVLGQAALAADGSWTFSDSIPENGTQSVGIRVTDNLGKVSQPPLGTTLQADQPHAGEVMQFISGNSTREGYTQNNVYDSGRLLYTKYDNYRSTDPSIITGYGDQIPFDIFDNNSSGKAVITNFNVRGPQHDTLNLNGFGLGSVLYALRHTSDVDGSAVIHNDAGHTLTLEGVTKAQLIHNQRDFSFS